MERLAGRTGGDSPADGPDLIRQFVARRPEAFQRVVELYASRIVGLAHRLLGWHGEVDDIVQDVLLAAWERAAHFRGDSSLWTYLAAITVNRCRAHVRRQSVRRLAGRLLGRLVRPDSPAADYRAIDSEVGAAVRSAVVRLPPKLREVIVLHYLQEMPIEQMCRVLNASRTAVQVRLHRGRQQLRPLLSQLSQETGRENG